VMQSIETMWVKLMRLEYDAVTVARKPGQTRVPVAKPIKPPYTLWQ